MFAKDSKWLSCIQEPRVFQTEWLQTNSMSRDMVSCFHPLMLFLAVLPLYWNACHGEHLFQETMISSWLSMLVLRFLLHNF